MDTVEFVKIMQRMCSNGCDNCPLNGDCIQKFGNAEIKVKMVEAWGKEHSSETYLENLKKKMPDYDCDDGGYPRICLKWFYHSANAHERCTGEYCETCFECWDRQIEKEENNE